MCTIAPTPTPASSLASLALDPRFCAWFGSSQMLDGALPRRMYHGTDTVFRSFDPVLLGSVSGSSDSKLGFWFSADRGRAAAAAEVACLQSGCNARYIMEVFLSIQNPLISPSIRNFLPSQSARLISRAKKAGRDGVIFLEGEFGPPDVVVFDPRQIKSATCNCGAYSKTDPDIYK